MRVTFWLFAHRFGYHADIAMRNEHRVRKLVTHPILVIEKLPQIVTLVVHVDATSGVRVMFHNDSGNLASRREAKVATRPFVKTDYVLSRILGHLLVKRLILAVQVPVRALKLLLEHMQMHLAQTRALLLPLISRFGSVQNPELIVHSVVA